jgi:hypothetical protein
MQTFVRGGSIEAILDANRKVDRCLHAGAMAIGAEVESQTILGICRSATKSGSGESLATMSKRSSGRTPPRAPVTAPARPIWATSPT